MGLEIDRLRSVRMLALDVDGILTDCRIWMDQNGEWRRFFSIRDGLGIKMLQERGYHIAIITASTAADIRARAKNLGINYFYEGAHDKAPAFTQLMAASGLEENQIAYMGDDLPDLPLLQRVGFSATVPEAMEDVKSAVHYVTRRPGGNGAVREVCDVIQRYGAFA